MKRIRYHTTALAVFGSLLFLTLNTANGVTYYADPANSVAPFGTINSSGQKTPIGPGLNFGSITVPNFQVAPNGTLYAFDSEFGGKWGSVNPTTGTFTQIGNLSTEFYLGDLTLPALVFDSAGELLASGYDTHDNPVFGILNLTTGAFQKTGSNGYQAVEGGENPGQVMATLPNGKTYYADPANSVAPFGTINSSGQKTPIGPGLNFGSITVPNFQVAPNGTLYAFDSEFGGKWGSVNPTTGTFTQIGNLSTQFYLGDLTLPALVFDSAGELLASGYDTHDNPVFGILNLTTGAFQKTGSNGYQAVEGGENPGQVMVTLTPEPSTFVLLGIGAISLLAYAWQRRRAT